MNRALLTALIALPACASAQTLLSMTASNLRPAPGESVDLVVEMKNEASNWCGLEVFFGDGEYRELRVDTLPLRLTKSYQAPGTYAVRVQGAFVRRGLRSAFACQGPAQTVLVEVVDPAKEEAARVAQQKAELLAQRERDLQRLQYVLTHPATGAAGAASAASTPVPKARRDKPAHAAEASSPASAASRVHDGSLSVFGSDGEARRPQEKAQARPAN